ncbi:F-actin-monooxygenase MICAL3 [Myotis lucifugus]|uniref:F-actin-monooxygenase MICAL3 n=1 Tax=Myotis lucifugus TaxID=59463 RepID=UPI000CCC41CC|nr:F-actin-monooxygenase MICAL3 [Myotis lucifugus]
MEESKNETMNQAHTLFDQFVQATTCKGTLKAFQELCDHLELKPKDYRSFYHKLKSKLNYWKAKALWAKLDKRGSHKDYKKGKACTNTKCLIIGAGPCGLRTAIDLSLLGAKVVVIEKRDAFSRNNVLHLWPFTIHDLRGLGAKKFYGKFCAGAIDHISIRQLQLILLKVALILGIEIHVSVEFQGLVHPPEDQENERIGWRALVHPKTHPVSEYEFEVIIGGDGRRNTLEGFRRKEFRGKLAIAITANFINRNTTAEAKVEEISGVAFIFNQKFFQELREATGIDLENIVYYKDDTHYFVMTAKKQSLLDKGVILHDTNESGHFNLQYTVALSESNGRGEHMNMFLQHSLFPLVTLYLLLNLVVLYVYEEKQDQAVDFDSLDEQNVEKNNQLAFDIAEKELGISPIMTGKEMASVGEPDKLSMVMYLTQFYEMFKDSLPSSDALDLNAEEKAVLIASTKSPISFLSKLGQTISRKRSPKDKKEKDLDGAGKRRKTSQSEEEEVPRVCRGRSTLVSTLPDRRTDVTLSNQNKVKYMATQLLAKFEENAPPQSTGIRRQGSVKKEFPQNLGGSDTCYFCQKRVYVMERLSAEGKFFHRSCFKCDYCATTLRLSAYAYDIEDGKFYCKPHYCYRLSSSAQRKRPAVTLLSGKEARGPLQDGPIADANAPASTITNPADRTPGSSVNGLEEPSIAKRLRGTPERIELENYRLSVKQAEELQEVPEETQAEHNLSSVLDKGLEEDVASSSSESEMEEEEEPPLPTSDLGGVPWKEAVRIHALLKGKSEEELDALKSYELNNDNEEEDYYEEEGEEDYDEEEEESSEVAGSQRLQQIINATDPLEIQADVHWTHVHEKEEEERTVPTSEPSTSRVPDLPSIRRAAVQAWLETVSGVPFDEDGLEEDVDSEPAEIEGEAAENGDTGDTGAELDDDQHWSDDSPSDAETEFCKQHQEVVEADLELNVSENQDERPPATLQHNKRAPSQVSSPTWSPSEQAVLFSPAHSPVGEGARIPLPSEAIKVKLPKEHLFRELLVSKAKFKAEVPTDQKAVHSPIQSQPAALLEARTHTSPVSSQGLSPLATSTITPTPHPICSQPKPSCEATIPSPTKSPICFQPVPAKTSTPLTPLHVKNQGDAKDRLGSPLAMDEALKPNDLVAEFWMKSAEIRRSLGLTPVDRSKGPKHSFPSPAFKPLSLKSYSVEKSPQDEGLHLLKPPSKRLAKSDSDQPSLPTPKSPSDRELKSSHEERRDLSSSSGLGLHGSSSNMKTLGSQSFNTSDSTMLTPPSSPPPPPPQDEEPATLQREPYQIYGQKETKPKASVIPPPTPATFMRPPREPAQLPWEEVRKSFVESVAEIPFADDVEDTYDDKTEDSDLQFFTPPSCWPLSDKALPPPLAKENVRLLTLESGVQLQKRGLPVVSPEAKELAEERMRAREKSIKSQVLRDAMAKQLSRMKEMEIGAETSSPPGGTCHKASSMPSKGKALGLESPKHPVHKGPEEPTLKHKNTSEEFLSPTLDSGAPDGSVTSSEGSSGKSKKRSSLFSPRRNKERKSKGEGRPLEKHSPDLLEEAAAKPRSLWKSVFSGYKKDKKKKGDNKSCSSTPSSGATVASSKHRMSPIVRAELQLRDQLSFSEDSDLSSDDILERVSQKSKREPRTYTEEELNAKLTRRVQKAARRQAKQEELKRLHRAQIIQRQLEQVEERQRQLEERGVAVEKALRGEADYWGESYYSDLIDLHLGGMGKKDDPKLMQEWFRLVQEKNAMVRYESELMIFARELELEDRQSRLQQELRERMAMEDHLKTEEELSEEKKILNEMLEVVEQRDALVALLEEQRLREKEEDKDLEAVMLSKGFSLNWS